MNQKSLIKYLTNLTALIQTSFSPALAQNSSLELAANTITEEDISREINVLSHDSLQGRNTPGPEIEKAASYLIKRFREMGLEPAGEEGTADLGDPIPGVHSSVGEWIRDWSSRTPTGTFGEYR